MVGTRPRAAEDIAGAEWCTKKWPTGHGSMSREHGKKEKNEANSPRPITAAWSRRRRRAARDSGQCRARVAPRRPRAQLEAAAACSRA